MWNAIQYVSTPITLIAFIVAVIALVYKAQLRQRVELFREAKDSPETFDKFLRTYSIKNDNLSKDQKYRLLVKEMEDKLTRLKIIAKSSIVIFSIAVSAIVATVIFGAPNQVPNGHDQVVDAGEHFSFDPPSPVLLTGNNIEIKATVLDKKNQVVDVPISWRVKDVTDNRYISISQEGSTVRVTRKPEANAFVSDDLPLIIELVVAITSSTSNEEALTDGINLIVKDSNNRGTHNKSLSYPSKQSHPSQAQQWVASASFFKQNVGLYFPSIHPISRTPISMTQRDMSFVNSLKQAIAFAEQTKSPPTNRPIAKPIVYLMDTRASKDLVYNPRTWDLGATNSQDIRSILGDLAIDSRVEPVNAEWRGDEILIEANPSLVVIHYSCFYGHTNPHDDDKRFQDFLKYIATKTQAHFLVYSRSQSIYEKEPEGQHRYLFPLMLERKLDVPGLRHRIHPFFIKRTPNLFCDSGTALNFKTEVKKILGLP